MKASEKHLIEFWVEIGQVRSVMRGHHTCTRADVKPLQEIHDEKATKAKK